MFTCTVYLNPKLRFTPEGCRSNVAFAKLDYDPFPYGIVLSTGVVFCWPIYQCVDKKWRACKIQTCGFYLENKTVTKLVENNNIYIREDGVLCDQVAKSFAVIPKELWKGECIRCGRCCMGERGTKRCKYLKEEL